MQTSLAINLRARRRDRADYIRFWEGDAPRRSEEVYPALKKCTAENAEKAVFAYHRSLHALVGESLVALLQNYRVLRIYLNPIVVCSLLFGRVSSDICKEQ
jgi:hypothetical protein